jgi:hypothetical protein
MGTFAFEARCVAVGHPQGECHLVGFADEKFDTRLYLLLQRAFEHDAQDVAHGMDTFHVEWCNQEDSDYGGIARFVLGPAGAEVTFEDDAAEALGGMKHLSIAFQLDPPEWLALREVLRNIFAGSDCLVVDGAQSSG